ncbi:MAG: ABC transporter permease [Myxococcales bacterium]|nr:ABC transporter permease [Myxococcales bacterium]
MSGGFSEALGLILSGSPQVWSAVRISCLVSGTATLIACALALPLGYWLGRGRFFGRGALVALVNTCVAVPTVVIGLVAFGMLSRHGPLGGLELLFTPAAMILGQTLLALPIVVSLVVAVLERAEPRLELTVFGLGGGRWRLFLNMLVEYRRPLAGAMLIGFGRVFSEVGVSMMLGGNIPGVTRNITTAIALETMKGEFSLGIALGILLLFPALLLVLMARRLSSAKPRRAP